MLLQEDALVEPYDLVESQIETGRFRWLDVVMRRWAFTLEKTLFETLGIIVEVQPEPVEWMRFGEFSSVYHHQQPIYVFQTSSHGHGLLLVDNRFAHACFCATPRQRLNEQPLQLPHFTPETQKALQRVLMRMLQDFEHAWQGVATVTISLKRMTTHPFRAKILQPSEKCVTAKLILRTYGFDADLILCFPYLTLDPILQPLSEKKVLSPETLEHYYDDIQDHFHKVLEDCEYDLVTELGLVELNAHEGQISLQVGQILPVRSNVGAEVVVRINGKRALTGVMGQSDENYAVQLVGLYEEKQQAFRKRPRPFSAIRWPKA